MIRHLLIHRFLISYKYGITIIYIYLKIIYKAGYHSPNTFKKYRKGHGWSLKYRFCNSIFISVINRFLLDACIKYLLLLSNMKKST
jgi:hypothetical protein